MAAMPNSRALAVDRRLAPSVDTPSAASLSFAPPEPTAPLPNAQLSPPRPPIAVVSSRALPASAIGRGGPIGAMSDYPVQLEKVQPPPLREDILARNRLLDWLAVKVHNRVVLVTAEAGYGKTTLLADFARRSRVLVLWYRLDRGDRDWAGFIAHLVAAVRRHAPSFGALTTSLIRETGASAPPLESVLDTFIRELTDLPPEPAALVLDDFHLVEDAADIRDIVRQLLERAPERLTFIFASRRTPPLRLARLRSLGEVAEIVTDDLRFDHDETQRLFRDAYSMTIEPTLVTELSRRTEGWAASLHLVRTALHDRDASQVRAFIRSLTGAEGHLYDYLAEEVVGDLPDELQTFLMRTSLLDRVDLVLAPVAAGLSPDETHRLIDEAERVGLFGRQPGPTRAARAHPLVRDFLQVRLARSITADELQQLHRSIAAAAEPVDWRVAVHHYIAGGDWDAARGALSGSLERILGSGAYVAAEEALTELGNSSRESAIALVIESRLALQRGQSTLAADLAEKAYEQSPTVPGVVLNLLSARNFVGDLQGALAAASLLDSGDRSVLSRIGATYRSTLASSLDGSIQVADEDLRQLISTLSRSEQHHYLGVALNNRSHVLRAYGDARAALSAAEEALEELARGSSLAEATSARLARGLALAHEGNLAAARLEYQEAARDALGTQAMEVGFESAEIEALYGDYRVGLRVLVLPGDRIGDYEDHARLSHVLLLTRAGQLEVAKRTLGSITPQALHSTPAFEARRVLAAARLAAALGDPDARDYALRAHAIAEAQGAGLWSESAMLLSELLRSPADASAAVVRAAHFDPSVLTFNADELGRMLSSLSGPASGLITAEAIRRPERWRTALSKALTEAAVEGRAVAARLLVEIGSVEDVDLLREAARRYRDRNLLESARDLARKLAVHVHVQDLGRVHLAVGDRVIDGSTLRRKVLSLLCLLLTRSNFAASRENVIEELWPDQDPVAALNSLNQTVYFLRRVLEPEYDERTSPGYLRQDTESIWLDTALVSSSSGSCLAVLRDAPGRPSRDHARLLGELYTDRFALDFPYEEWAAPYRESLHAGYLRVMEQAIGEAATVGDFATGIELAERVHAVDPEAEEVLISLVRSYRVSGAHAAAAERYQRYAATLREIGITAEPIGDL